MKKAFALLFILAVIMFALAGYALADETPAFVVSSAQAAPGDVVELTVSTVNNPGIASFELTVEYDSNALEWTDIKKGGLDGLWDLAVGTDAVWIDADNYADDTVILTLTFKVKDTAQAGVTSVTVSYLPDNVFNEDEENVFFAVIPGGVEVIGNQVSEIVTADSTENPMQDRTSALGGSPSPHLDNRNDEEMADEFTDNPNGLEAERDNTFSENHDDIQTTERAEEGLTEQRVNTADTPDPTRENNAQNNTNIVINPIVIGIGACVIIIIEAVVALMKFKKNSSKKEKTSRYTR